MRGVAIYLAVVALGGCVIARDWDARGASGTVVDARTGKPLAGGSVFRTIGDKTSLVATTDSVGRFSVSEAGRWYVTIPMGMRLASPSCYFTCQATLRPKWIPALAYLRRRRRH
jgi:hypothetical protein